MARNQIDMNKVSLPEVPKPSVGKPKAGFDFGNSASSSRRRKLMSEMPDMSEVQTDEADTSAGRLDQMLESGSPLMQRARTQGMQQANSRGLLNSSMAAGAAQGAMIDRAQPFALQDSNNLMQNARQNAAAQNEQAMLQSSTLADSFLNNQQFQQQGALNQQNYDIQSGLAQQQAGLQAQQAAQGYAYDRGMAGYQADLQAARDERVAGLDRDMARLAQIQTQRDELLFEQDLDRTAQEYGLRSDMLEQEGNQAMEKLYGTSLANAWGVMGNNVTDIVAQSLSNIQAIQSNPNINADDKTRMIQKVLDMREADTRFQAELYGRLPYNLEDTGVFPEIDLKADSFEEAQVLQAYEDILGRQPSNENLSYYTQRVRQQGIEKVRSEIEDSPEAKNRV